MNIELTEADEWGWAVLTYSGEGIGADERARAWLREQGIHVLQWGGWTSNPERTRVRIRVGLGRV